MKLLQMDFSFLECSHCFWQQSQTINHFHIPYTTNVNYHLKKYCSIISSAKHFQRRKTGKLLIAEEFTKTGFTISTSVSL